MRSMLAVFFVNPSSMQQIGIVVIASERTGVMVVDMSDKEVLLETKIPPLRQNEIYLSPDVRHSKPKHWNRHAEILAVCFAEDNQRIITSDTQAIWVWENVAARKRTGESDAKVREPHEQ